MTSTQPSFKFMGLPAELRNEIYRFVALAAANEFTFFLKPKYIDVAQELDHTPAGLLASSKKVHEEFYPIWSMHRATAWEKATDDMEAKIGGEVPPGFRYAMRTLTEHQLKQWAGVKKRLRMVESGRDTMDEELESWLRGERVL